MLLLDSLTYFGKFALSSLLSSILLMGLSYCDNLFNMLDIFLGPFKLFGRCFFFALQINDRYEFPLQLDLDRDDRKYLSPEADTRVRNLYTLHR